MKLYIQSSRSQMLFAKFSFRYMIIKDTKLSIVFFCLISLSVVQLAFKGLL